MSEKSSVPYAPISGFIKSGDFIYSLQESRKSDGSLNYKDGAPQLCNDIYISIRKDNFSKFPADKIDALAKHLQKAANDFLFIEFGFDSDGCDCEGEYKCTRCKANEISE